ncbi:MAG: hypothetical protein WBK55_07650 [Alphaproteobacteria bacterium]
MFSLKTLTDKFMAEATKLLDAVSYRPKQESRASEPEITYPNPDKGKPLSETTHIEICEVGANRGKITIKPLREF